MKPVIIGAGLAGLTVALSLAPRPVILLSSRELGEESSSILAQGGVAAAIGADDSASAHAKDTQAAGAGLCDPVIVEAVTGDGTKVIETLTAQGVAFDRDAENRLRLGLEAAHSHRRIVHSVDKTGAAIMAALIAAVRATPSIQIVENAVAVELITAGGRIDSVAFERDGEISVLLTRQVVLATGGAGALWKETSNPLGSWGRGLALAAKAGAVLGDLEFMQFHPTAMDVGQDPMPLLSEALRGEGCVLIDDQGERFVDELQPRDIVARAIWHRRAEGHRVYLDARKALGQNFAKRFPAVHALCSVAGIDPAVTPMPVAPAAHYHMGGVMTDIHGRTSIEGLWACGEVACTGLHGANRLASNSLLEAASFGRRVAEDIGATSFPRKRESSLSRESGDTTLVPRRRAALDPRFRGDDADVSIRSLMSDHVGVMRSAEGLQTAIDQLASLAVTSDKALIGLMIAVSASRREESRGGHARTDFSEANPAWQKHQTITLAEIQPWLEPHLPRRAVGF